MSDGQSQETGIKCKYCLRDKATVSWRRAKGRECSTCPRVLDNNTGWVETKGGKQQMATAMPNDTDLHVEWMQKVVSHESNRGDGRYTTKNDQTISAFQEDGMEGRRNLGVFWPLKFWQKMNPETTVKDKGYRIQIWRGQKGVILTPEPGEKIHPECEELWQTSKTGVKRDAVLADSSQGDCDLDAVHKERMGGNGWWW